MLKFDVFKQGGKNGKSEELWCPSNQQSALKYGIGCFSKKGAYEFVDQLKAAGRGCWQILPLRPAAAVIHLISVFHFAGNAYFISLED